MLFNYKWNPFFSKLPLVIIQELICSMKKLVSLTPHARGPPSLRLAINKHLQLTNVKVKRGNKADRAQEQSTDRSVPFAVPTCITTLCCFEASWPAYAQGEAFVLLFTIICYERLSKAGERKPALWDKRPFVFNQSHGLNEKMFQMTRVIMKRRFRQPQRF